MKEIEKSEEGILKSFENDEWNSVKELKNQKSEYSRYAKNTLARNKRINIRLSEKDLADLKAKSIEEGIPYQTLISSILHKYIHGKFREL